MSIKLIFNGRTHKENESINDCQDYFQANLENNCFAIADGASQSFYPSIWAELLVNHFCQNPEINQNNWNDWLQPIQEKWFQEVEQRVIKAKNENRPIWVTSQNRFNFREPATSTFIGLQLIEDQVKGSIVGDSCLFIVEGDQSSKTYQLIQTYLLKTSRDFNDSPGYFASYKKDNNFTPHDFKISLNQKKSSNNLYFILATDALSEYIFKCTENDGNNIFETLLSISSPEIFEDFVASARNSDNIKMKNDDVTLLILSIPNRSIDRSSLQSRDEIEGNRKVFPSSINEGYGKENKSSLQSRYEIEGNTKVSPASSNKQSSKETQNSSNVIFRQLISAVQFPNLTQKSIPKVPIISSYDELVSINKDLRNENTILKYQRLGLGICLFGISLLFGILINGKQENITKLEQPANTNSNQAKTKATPVSTEKSKLTLLKKGISIYKDKELTQVLIDSVSNQYTVPIVEEVDNWIKFKMPIYIHQTLITDPCISCKSDEIETITPDTNIVINLRSSPSRNGILFAQLKDKSKFKKLEVNSGWYKFEFVGYIKK
jgi:serine/threonine protein phosphatase PrpC